MFLFLCVHVNYNFSQGEVCGNIEIRENHNVVPLLYIPITSLQNALYVVNCSNSTGISFVIAERLDLVSSNFSIQILAFLTFQLKFN